MRDLPILLMVIMYYLLCIRYCMILLFVVPKGDAIRGYPSLKVSSNTTDIPDPLYGLVSFGLSSSEGSKAVKSLYNHTGILVLLLDIPGVTSILKI